MIDICIIATLRPEILDRTLASFTKNLFFAEEGGFSEKDFRVIINVDPVGHDIPGMKVVDVVYKYFPYVVYRIADTPHFSKAFIWCWENTNNDFIFQLEEDWELVIPINLSDMVATMKSDPNLMHLRLSTWKSEEKLKQWKWMLDYNGSYFVVPKHANGTIGFCGHPSLNSLAFIKTCVSTMTPTINPEKQIKHMNKELWKIMKNKEFGVFHKQFAPKAILDTGRAWMVENGFIKSGNKEWFTNWEKI